MIELPHSREGGRESKPRQQAVTSNPDIKAEIWGEGSPLTIGNGQGVFPSHAHAIDLFLREAGQLGFPSFLHDTTLEVRKPLGL